MSYIQVIITICLSVIAACALLALGMVIGQEQGMRMEACEPYTSIQSIDGHRAVCEMPDGGIVIRNY